MTGGKPSKNLAVPIVERGCRAGQERGGKKSIERKLVIIWVDVGVKEGGVERECRIRM